MADTPECEHHGDHESKQCQQPDESGEVDLEFEKQDRPNKIKEKLEDIQHGGTFAQRKRRRCVANEVGGNAHQEVERSPGDWEHNPRRGKRRLGKLGIALHAFSGEKCGQPAHGERQDKAEDETLPIHPLCGIFF